MSGANELTSMAFLQRYVAARGKTLPNAGQARGSSAGRMKNVHEKTAMSGIAILPTAGRMNVHEKTAMRCVSVAVNDEPAVGGSQHCAASEQF
jgi:hypothetical protein